MLDHPRRGERDLDLLMRSHHPKIGRAGQVRAARPWVNFAAGWNAHLFAASGHLTGEDAETAHLARLTFADGTTIEDVPDNGVVLFYASRGVVFPARVEILTAAGDLLAEYDEFNDLE
jgi:hypothetical protein